MKISSTKVSLFKACRRAYYFRYVEGLEPLEKSEALERGIGYHERIEKLYETGDIDGNDFSKENAMAAAYKKHIYPFLPCKKAEEWIEDTTEDGDKIIGRLDALTLDGRVVEHKTTSLDIDGKYMYDLQWNEQVLMYMLLTGTASMVYTVCRKPTIKQCKGETEEQYFQRCVSWYDYDTQNRIRMLEISRSEEEIADFAESLADTIDEMKRAERDGCFYRNPCHCRSFGNRCEFSGICLHYDLENIVDFRRNK